MVVDPITFQVNTVMSTPTLMYPPSTFCFLAVVSVCLWCKLTIVCAVSVIVLFAICSCAAFCFRSLLLQESCEGLCTWPLFVWALVWDGWSVSTCSSGACVLAVALWGSLTACGGLVSSSVLLRKYAMMVPLCAVEICLVLLAVPFMLQHCMSLLAVLYVCMSALLVEAVFCSHDFIRFTLPVCLLSAEVDALVTCLVCTFLCVLGLHTLFLRLCSLSPTFFCAVQFVSCGRTGLLLSIGVVACSGILC